jgi:hypothetical protein
MTPGMPQFNSSSFSGSQTNPMMPMQQAPMSFMQPPMNMQQHQAPMVSQGVPVTSAAVYYPPQFVM